MKNLKEVIENDLRNYEDYDEDMVVDIQTGKSGNITYKSKGMCHRVEDTEEWESVGVDDVMDSKEFQEFLKGGVDNYLAHYLNELGYLTLDEHDERDVIDIYWEGSDDYGPIIVGFCEYTIHFRYDINGTQLCSAI